MNDKLQFIRHRIEHGDNLINQRLSALVGSQAFLLTAFAISLNAPKEFFSPHYEPVHRLLTHMLPVAGNASVPGPVMRFSTSADRRAPGALLRTLTAG